MPWNEVDIVNKRLEFINAIYSQKYTMAELCRAFDISRPTGYKWWSRFREEGEPGLINRNSAPKLIPHQTPQEVRDKIIETKKAHLYWGPKKVLDNIKKHHPAMKLPADSTAGEILKKAGLTKRKKRKRGVPADLHILEDCQNNNQVWSMDFKGDFKMGNGERCYPLTITDNYSRYLLSCIGLPNVRFSETRPWVEWTFREYGLPEVILTDNGSPFSSRAAGGISRLSREWILLGIRPSRIVPGEPTQNGRHERMHRVLKAETAHPPRYSMKGQQQCFDFFCEEYNYERSHEGIARRFPGEVYQPALRPYPNVILAPEYEEGLEVRRVKRSGEIKWRGDSIYISQILGGDRVCLEEVDNDIWEVRFSFHPLGKITAGSHKLIHESEWHQKNKTEK